MRSYLDGARNTARFLADSAWNPELKTFPFEHPSSFAYFFDCGIIVRGLMAVWRQTARRTAARHRSCRLPLDADRFRRGLRMPSDHRTSFENSDRANGAVVARPRLLSAQIGTRLFRRCRSDLAIRCCVKHGKQRSACARWTFSRRRTDEVTRYGVMDRLHAYCYFLEALTAVLDRPECQSAYATGMAAVERHLREIAPVFVRSDFYAQLIRALIYGTGYRAARCAHGLRSRS